MRLIKAILGLLGRSEPCEEPEEDNWTCYLTKHGGAPASMLYDRRFENGPPPSHLPIWLDVSIAFRSADERGMPHTGELARLDPLEERLVSILRLVGAVHVAASATRGRRHWYFYAPSADARNAAERVLAEVMDDSPALKMREDPQWSMYRERILPTPRERRAMLDMHVVRALAEAGDVLERERTIEHYAYFDHAAHAERFAAWATENGFDVNEVRPPTEEIPRHAVLFSHTGPAIPAAITEKTSACEEEAARCGGEYDGWETAIVKGDEG